MKYYYHERIIVINKCFALVILQTIWFLFGEYTHTSLPSYFSLAAEYYAEACNYPFILFSLAFRFPFSLAISSPRAHTLLHIQIAFSKSETLSRNVVYARWC